MVNLGELSNDVCLHCGASPPSHRHGCIETSDFWGRKDTTSMARSLRLATVQNVYRQKLVTYEQACEALQGPLKQSDNSTVHDDSKWLKQP